MGRLTQHSPIIGATLLILIVVIGGGRAGELDYAIVDRMPDVRGELKRSIEGTDEARGVYLTQDLYSEDFDHAWIQTFVTTAFCRKTDSTSNSAPFLIAIKYPPKKPATFTIAGLHDVYKQVYVRDRNSRIRLYEDVSGQSMLELSDTFLPLCLKA